MANVLGSATRARELQRLFEAWRQAYDAGDERAARAARRAIDEVLGGNKPRASDLKKNRQQVGR
jgi:hypothetical protein